MFFNRFHELENLIKKQKVLIVYGPRRVGKTTLLNNFLEKTDLKYKLDSGDNIKIQQIFSSSDFDKILGYAEGYDLIALDEAQQIKNVGQGLKILVDQIPNLFVIATGSSSFDLSQKIGEPLTGRKRTIVLYPLTQMELLDRFNKFELKEKLEEFLIFGSYPEVLKSESEKEKKIVLRELVNSYLLRDIFSLERLRSSDKILNLLKLISFQVGNEVSLNELAAQIKLDVKTIDRYLDILEKSFVIKKISGFSGNLRKEITSKAKYYFLDNGVRNAVISQFNSLENRSDTGVIFENFVMMERMKFNEYNNQFINSYFWRTYDGQEIDLIEEHQGELSAVEIKWSLKKEVKPPPSWAKNYPNAKFKLVNRENYLDFIIK